MPDSPRLLAPLDGVQSLRRAAVPLLAGAVALLVAAGVAAGWSIAARDAQPTADPCALPPGIELRALGPGQRDRVAERAVACADLENGRMTAAEYRAALQALDRRPVEPPAPLPDMVWASRLRGFSTEWGPDSWSASKVLGPPDARPWGTDSVNAWASVAADSGIEFLEVELAGQHRMSGIEIVESLNPGAVSSVQLLLADGSRSTVAVPPRPPEAHVGHQLRLEFACTEQPVVGVRVTLSSNQVPGWNEIDAIGGQPCRD